MLVPLRRGLRAYVAPLEARVEGIVAKLLETQNNLQQSVLNSGAKHREVECRVKRSGRVTPYCIGH